MYYINSIISPLILWYDFVKFSCIIKTVEIYLAIFFNQTAQKMLDSFQNSTDQISELDKDVFPSVETMSKALYKFTL